MIISHNQYLMSNWEQMMKTISNTDDEDDNDDDDEDYDAFNVLESFQFS